MAEKSKPRTDDDMRADRYGIYRNPLWQRPHFHPCGCHGHRARRCWLGNKPLSGFVLGLREAEELRSAILLAILSFVIYPVLPDHAVDPWGLFEPRSTWGTVILIAVLGFVNYVLWRLYGSRGIEITGFLGGLVNSTATVAELATRLKGGGEQMLETVYRGIMFATAAMVLRNAVLLLLLAPASMHTAALPLVCMFVSSAALAMLKLEKSPAVESNEAMAPLHLESPFSLTAALKFGMLFLALQIAGTLGQRYLGIYGFYAVCVARRPLFDAHPPLLLPRRFVPINRFRPM